MIETFIYFISTTNPFASILLCLGFAIFTLGLLVPFVNFIFNCIWSFIDEKEISSSLWWIDKCNTLLRKVIGVTLDFEVHEINNCYSVYSKSRCKYIYKNMIKYQEYSDYDTEFTSQEIAELRAENLNSTKDIGINYYWQLVILAPLALTLISILLHYFFWPTVYLGSVIGTMFVLRVIRRLQKAGIKLVEELKAHKELNKDEAHPDK